MTEPEATFSACFGGAFLMWHPMKYAAMLAQKMEQHGTSAWLVNTGCALPFTTLTSIPVQTASSLPAVDRVKKANKFSKLLRCTFSEARMQGCLIMESINAPADDSFVLQWRCVETSERVGKEGWKQVLTRSVHVSMQVDRWALWCGLTDQAALHARNHRRHPQRRAQRGQDDHHPHLQPACVPPARLLSLQRLIHLLHACSQGS